MTRARWVVTIHDVGDGDGEPFMVGPYTEARARQITEAFNKRRGDNSGWWATTWPLTRYSIPELVAMHEPQEVAA